jgi:hypothetical protein
MEFCNDKNKFWISHLIYNHQVYYSLVSEIFDCYKKSCCSEDISCFSDDIQNLFWQFPIILLFSWYSELAIFFKFLCTISEFYQFYVVALFLNDYLLMLHSKIASQNLFFLNIMWWLEWNVKLYQLKLLE